MCWPKRIFFGEVVSWEKVIKIAVKMANNGRWSLTTNTNNVDIADRDIKRFNIERLFQDVKGSVFDTEKAKMRKHDRLKRLLDLSVVCRALMVFPGHFLKLTK
jgi:tRNA splicing ligase